MTKTDPIIAVKDVEASAKWYGELFGFKNVHGGKEFAVLMDGNEVVLCLHKWGTHEHPSLADQNIPTGNGLLLYFRTDQMEGIRKKAKEREVVVIEEIHENQNSLRKEFSFRDPDGYFLTVSEFHTYEG